MERFRTANDGIAGKLREMAELLEAQGANPFRSRAYRRAADAIEGLGRDLRSIAAEGGTAGLTDLPHIGEGIAAAIREMLATGRMSRLERLRGEVDARRLFRSIPGIGPVLARRIETELHVDSLEALEVAAHDGRLAAVVGIGPRRAAAIASVLAQRLGRVRSRPARPGPEPGVDRLLDVDDEYRRGAAQGTLPRIAPRRFNPGGDAWLPVLHTQRGPRRNTARTPRPLASCLLDSNSEGRSGASDERLRSATSGDGPAPARRPRRPRSPPPAGHGRGSSRVLRPRLDRGVRL